MSRHYKTFAPRANRFEAQILDNEEEEKKYEQISSQDAKISLAKTEVTNIKQELFRNRAFNKVEKGLSVIRFTDRGPHILTLNKTLEELGYKAPGNNTLFWNETKTSLINFQRDHGIKASGILDAKTLLKIDKALEKIKDKKPEKVDKGNTLSAKLEISKTNETKDPNSKTYTIIVAKNQKFKGKLIQTDEELNRFAEHKMGLTRHLVWKPEYTVEYIKGLVANGGTVKYEISPKTNSIEKETEELSSVKKQFIKDPTSTAYYVQNTRILDLLKQLSDEEIADYNSKTSEETTNLATIEASLKAYIEKRDKNRRDKDELETVKTKLYGLENLYEEYKDYMQLLADVKYFILTKAGKEFESKLTESLNKNGFKSISEFESFIKRYEAGFEKETVNIGVEILQRYKHTLYEEEKKLNDDVFLEKLLEGITKSGAKQNFRDANYADNGASGMAIDDNPNQQARDLKKEMEFKAKQKEAQGNSAIQSLSVHTPLVSDDGFDKKAFAKITDKKTLRIYLQNYIASQRRKTDDVISNIEQNPEHVYELDKLYKISYAKQNIKEGSIYDKIITTKYTDLKDLKILLNICEGVFAAALIAATWGAATPVVIAGSVTSLAISIDAAYESISEYKKNREFHDVGLLSDDPSLVWVVVAIAGVALDAGALSQVLKSAKPIATAAKAFNEAEDGTKAIAKLEGDLAKIEGLSANVRANIVKQAELETKLKLAMHEARVQMATANMGINVNALPQLTRAAYYGLKKGAIDFENFVLQLKVMKIIDNFEHLSAEEKLILKQAFENGKAINALDETINWSAKSEKTFGHAFTRHGKKNLKRLIDRARGEKTPQGLWTNDDEAAEIIKMNWMSLKEGENIIDIPKGLGKVIMPDGTIIENITKALVIKNKKGATNLLNTAYPKIIE